MEDIFISYASEDRDRVIPIVKALKDHGWSVWWDRSILPGDEYDQVIDEAITAAKCVVVLWSRNSIKSRWVKGEATISDKEKKLVPAQIDPIRLPIAFVMMETADLTDWKEDSNHVGFQSLISALTKKIGPPRARVAMPGPQRVASEKSIPAETQIFSNYIRLGSASESRGELEKAARYYNDGLSIMEKLTARDPSNTQWLDKLTVCLIMLGKVKEAQRELEKAEQHYDVALSIMKKLAKHDPTNHELQIGQLEVNNMLCNVAKDQSKWEKAEQYYNDCLSMIKKLAERDPSNTQWLDKLTVCLTNLGEVEERQGKLEKAEQHYYESQSIIKKLAADDPDNHELKVRLLLITQLLVNVSEAQGKLEMAMQSKDDGDMSIIELLKKYPKSDGKSA